MKYQVGDKLFELSEEMANYMNEEEKAEAAKAQAEWEQAKPEPTAEERLEAVENAVLALMGGGANV